MQGLREEFKEDNIVPYYATRLVPPISIQTLRFNRAHDNCVVVHILVMCYWLINPKPFQARLQEYQVHSYTGGPAGGPMGETSGRLPPIREFQREFREGRRESAAAASASTRIR